MASQRQRVGRASRHLGFFVRHVAGLGVLRAGAGAVLHNLRARSFAHPLRLSHARCVATSPLRKRFVCRAQAVTILRSCSAFGVALASIKGRASVPPNRSFKADGYAAAQLQRQARRDCEDGIVHVRGGQFHRLV